jgi:hypothetical protein
MAADPTVADPLGEPRAEDLATQLARLSPMELAAHRVLLQRKKKALEAALTTTQEELVIASDLLLTSVEGGSFPESARVEDATVFLFRQVWASPASGPDGKADHDRLTAVLDVLGLDEYKPSTVNTQSLSAYVREEIKKAPAFDDGGNVLTLEQRARKVLPSSLVDALRITEKREMRVNGA